MNLNEYLKSLLSDKKLKEVRAALKSGKTIIVSGKQGPTGKSTLVDVLRGNGYNAVEKFQTYDIELDKTIKNITPNFRNEIRCAGRINPEFEKLFSEVVSRSIRTNFDCIAANSEALAGFLQKIWNGKIEFDNLYCDELGNCLPDGGCCNEEKDEKDCIIRWLKLEASRG